VGVPSLLMALRWIHKVGLLIRYFIRSRTQKIPIPSLVAISKSRDREKDGSRLLSGAGWRLGRGERLVDGRAIEELDSWFPLLEPARVFVPLNGFKNRVAFDCFSCLIRSTRC
jgi:hypothetical protein